MNDSICFHLFYRHYRSGVIGTNSYCSRSGMYIDVGKGAAVVNTSFVAVAFPPPPPPTPPFPAAHARIYPLDYPQDVMFCIHSLALIYT